MSDQYVAAQDRYEAMPYRRTGRSGLKLPAISLGLWHNFGDDVPIENQRAVLRRAFDLGITHFDLANNYGPPYGSAETNFGRILREDFSSYREELVISSKAGWDMWPGPYGFGGSRKYLLSSLDQSLGRLGVDYVDIFYSHRPDAETPIDETAGALISAVQQGKALYAGISSYSPERTREIAALLAAAGVPLLIHQPSYSMLNRWIEQDLLSAVDDLGVGVIAFSPLAQGMLTDRYLNGVPENSRAAQGKSLDPSWLTDDALTHIRALNDIAADRGQSLAQLALSWALRDSRVTSVLIGASSVAQLEANVGALDNLEFSTAELASIDQHAKDSGINLWAEASSI
ncbi:MULTISPECIES: L-glyceraldehyde 3-phosphate reductase [Rhodococcus]|uniref:L-glyceraldehyde 3-phosphate reductase n=2 Tax=Rhodococcus erythropolis TaxID=1833 RepID=A0A8I0ZUW6_RHOER|nr:MULTISPECIES: L-glyceraldehyde 3-phosphate reductase [Rhodococcus]MCD2153127.1 L-glyceraldehyde 3-phosphate reductase [Rhodococcus cerastii]ALU69605.1 aldo/keto reductase [Rhodococcus erythropolis R138]MBH5145975.1 L-glyceraldehyde 3-phosphate reductase [Rhodococcus erythropolis]MCQ4123602.1 L-glyceraldehyde 3-phosphate reductase [Rhodococcus erythropolis]MDJ0406969.1 L-glyceraldehyde 3-phosphate reductase [Rhodococcus erythropolis]